MVRDDEANARAVNAQPWEPPPGMVKRRCPEWGGSPQLHPGRSAAAAVMAIRVSRMRIGRSPRTPATSDKFEFPLPSDRPMVQTPTCRQDLL